MNDCVFEMKGPDARDFLHRLTTADVRNLQPGESAMGFFLEATGRVRAVFSVFCTEREAFLLVTPRGRDDHWKKELLAVLDQFTFGEKYELKERADLRAIRVKGQTPSVPSLSLGKANGAEVFLAIVSGTDALPGAISDSDWTPLRIEALIADVDHEITPTVNPLEIGLRRAIADQKGCYPGQEVIEKIIAIGSPSRRLVRIRGKGTAPALSDKILASSGGEVGQITSATAIADGFVALGLVRKTHAKENEAVKIGSVESNTEAKIEAIASYEA